MAIIDCESQDELPIAQQITCRRCKGVGTVYYVRTSAEVVGGKRIGCPECKGRGRIDLTDQLFRCVIVSQAKKNQPRRVARVNDFGPLL